GEAAPEVRPAFVLVHGAWHGAWCFERVVPGLVALGYSVAARDLPGHGLNALFPASYAPRTSDAAFASEVSPLAALTLDDYANSVIATIDKVRAAGFDKIILVGHSMSGMVVSRVGELAAEKLSRLVYLAAHMPQSGKAAGAYFGDPEAASGLSGLTLLGDAAATGAFRIDPLSNDATYLANLKLGYYNDVAQPAANAARNLLTPDIPAGPWFTPITLTAARWGSLPRHYIKCLQDNAVPPALADRFIAEANALTPSNPTRVHTLDSSHSPFLSMPNELVSLLGTIAIG
ncbi:MAG: alpha/beta fold hydrolase, partial [Variovorax sp.]